MTFALNLYEKIKSFKNEVAISQSGKNITYKFLNDISLRIGTLLDSNRLNSNVIGIVGQRNLSVYYGILGSIYSGCTYVPINDRYTKDRIYQIINEANINVLIGTKESIYSIKDVINSTGIKFILFPENDDIKYPVNSFKSAKVFDKYSISELEPIYPVQSNPSDIIYLLFTSGSTGKPKGVMVTNQNVDTFIKNTNSFYDLPIGYKASQSFDLSFDASVVDIFLTWMNGGQICILNESELLMPYEYIKREKLNFWYSVPTLASFMFKMGYLIPNSFPDLKYSSFGGERLSKKLADAWQLAAPNSTVENVYGPTETTVNITRFFYKKEYKDRKFCNDVLPVGKIFDEHSFAIINNKMENVIKGSQGQLIVKGKQISSGYINNNDKTKESFRKFSWDNTNQIWYLTGDLAFVNNSNEIEIVGRIDDQIKIAGRRVELGEIEAAFLKSNLIKEIVIVPKKDSDGSVKAFIGFTTSKLSSDDLKNINQSALKYIEKLFLPSKIVVIEKMPETSRGKTDRKKLFELAKDL